MFDFNNYEMVTNKLNELNERDIPVMTLEKLCQLYKFEYLKEERATEDEINQCNEHLGKYCEYGYNDGADIFSDEVGYFQFGLLHGEMISDDNCMDRTYYHYFILDGQMFRVDLLLQYHPSVYSFIDDDNIDENNHEEN